MVPRIPTTLTLLHDADLSDQGPLFFVISQLSRNMELIVGAVMAESIAEYWEVRVQGR